MIHKYFVDDKNEKSFANKLRRERFKILLSMLEDSTAPVSILDIGGTSEYWETMTADSTIVQKIHLTILNTKTNCLSHPKFTMITGDGRSMPQFKNNQFDIVFSNSTIEHVGSFNDQKMMADEIRRVGSRYCIQTPNIYFPIEPHFVFPMFQFFPIALKLWLIQNFSLGWYPRIKNRQKALYEVSSIRLLSRKELIILFPGCKIHEEKFNGLTKSFIAYQS